MISISRLNAILFIVIGIWGFCENSAQGKAVQIDLAKYGVAVPAGSDLQKATDMLIEETAKRTGIRMTSGELPKTKVQEKLILGTVEQLSALCVPPTGLALPEKEEGFIIWVDSTSPTQSNVYVMGHDKRGVLFGVGRLLRLMHMGKGTLTLDADTRIAAAPKYPLRGHQIGYRGLSNCYDAWTPKQYEQYMRDMAVFGGNAIEITSFKTPEGKDNDLMPITRGEMTKALSNLCHAYGIAFWFFAGYVCDEVGDPEIAAKQLAAAKVLLETTPHLDGLFLTGGDGNAGKAKPDAMLDWIGKLAPIVQKLHPETGLWISNQGFDPEYNKVFFDYLQTKQPEWLTGVVYGAWSRIPASEERERTPKRYPIRRYPDIGHCVRAQYPVPEWDPAFARTLGREPFCPRPMAEARIHNLNDEYTDGFITYSDGVSDDVNKVIWTYLGWDPEMTVRNILVEYCRYFFGDDFAETGADGLLALEQNWVGPLATNAGIQKTLKHWQAMEERADKELLNNWRFQLCLLRAYYDAYTQQRLIRAKAIEEEAYTALREAETIGVEAAIQKARKILAQSDQNAETAQLRKKIEPFGPALFKNIGMQLDVKTFHAQTPERGAILDFLDEPLNNRVWMNAEFDAILAGRETATTPLTPVSGDLRLTRIKSLINWENPGPGGFYDDLGNLAKQPHLVRQKAWADDPAALASPHEGFSYDWPTKGRLSWLDQGETLFGTPLRMHYEGLDSNATYRLRVVYYGRYSATMKLMADGTQIHGPMGHTSPTVEKKAVSEEDEKIKLDPTLLRHAEFPVPQDITRDGVLDLEWQLVSGRGCQVAEVWLIKQ